MKVEELFSVRGKVALVTGGSRGIGEMIARAYVENGAKAYITARNADACDALARELSRIGECISIPADLSRMQEVERLAAEMQRREKRLDILVNNAGASWGDEFEDFPMRKDYREPDDYEYEPTPHDDVLEKAKQHYTPRPQLDGAESLTAAQQ